MGVIWDQLLLPLKRSFVTQNGYLKPKPYKLVILVGQIVIFRKIDPLQNEMVLTSHDKFSVFYKGQRN